MDDTLRFAPFTSEVDLPFYGALFSSKLEDDKLDDSARKVLGLYSPQYVEPDQSCRMQILGNALTNPRYGFGLHSLLGQRMTNVPGPVRLWALFGGRE